VTVHGRTVDRNTSVPAVGIFCEIEQHAGRGRPRQRRPVRRTGLRRHAELHRRGRRLRRAGRSAAWIFQQVRALPGCHAQPDVAEQRACWRCSAN
jgi:hypothetical protein